VPARTRHAAEQPGQQWFPGLRPDRLGPGTAKVREPILSGRLRRGGHVRPAQQGRQPGQPGQLGLAVLAVGQVPHDRRAVGRGDRAGEVHAQLGPDIGAFTRTIHVTRPARPFSAGISVIRHNVRSRR
jgi:hypothetical protein